MQQYPVAYKVCIKDVLTSPFIREDGWDVSYCEVRGQKVSQVNIVAIALTPLLPQGNFYQAVVEDFSGKMPLRAFETAKLPEAQPGDVLLVIGRVREYNDERYIIPQIIKKLNTRKWLNLRAKELQGNVPLEEEKKEEPVVEEVVEKPEGVTLTIYDKIKKMDTGDGVDYETVLENVDRARGEKAIEALLRDGEIFEVASGKLKVLD